MLIPTRRIGAIRRARAGDAPRSSSSLRMRLRERFATLDEAPSPTKANSFLLCVRWRRYSAAQALLTPG